MTLVGQADAGITGSDLACRTVRTLETLNRLPRLARRAGGPDNGDVRVGAMAAPRRDAPVTMARWHVRAAGGAVPAGGSAAGAARAHFYVIQPKPSWPARRSTAPRALQARGSAAPTTRSKGSSIWPASRRALIHLVSDEAGDGVRPRAARERVRTTSRRSTPRARPRRGIPSTSSGPRRRARPQPPGDHVRGGGPHLGAARNNPSPRL